MILLYNTFLYSAYTYVYTYILYIFEIISLLYYIILFIYLVITTNNIYLFFIVIILSLYHCCYTIIVINPSIHFHVYLKRSTQQILVSKEQRKIETCSAWEWDGSTGEIPMFAAETTWKWWHKTCSRFSPYDSVICLLRRYRWFWLVDSDFVIR